MTRSKQFGKSVSDLSPDELRREKLRCETLIRYGNSRVAKGLEKRLREIERRLDDEE